MTTWHAPDDVLERYSSRPSEVDEVTAMSVEAHLLECGECRAVVSAVAGTVAISATSSASVALAMSVPGPLAISYRPLGIDDQ